MAKAGKLLIVDDNRSILSAVKLLTESFFEEVLTLPSPNTLISTLQKAAPDVVLLDMNFHAGINTGNEGLYWLKDKRRITLCFYVGYPPFFGRFEKCNKIVIKKL